MTIGWWISIRSNRCYWSGNHVCRRITGRDRPKRVRGERSHRSGRSSSTATPSATTNAVALPPRAGGAPSTGSSGRCLRSKRPFLKTPCTPRDPLHGLRVPTAANVAADAPVDPQVDVRAQRCCACAAQRTAPALGAPHPANRRASAACRSMRHASGSASQEVAQLCCPSGTYSHLRRRDQPEQRYSAEKGSIIMSDKGNELDMLTAQQVHDLTGVPISTLHDWASKRERGIEAPGPHHLRLSDRHRRWARRDVVAWLNAARI